MTRVLGAQVGRQLRVQRQRRIWSQRELAERLRAEGVVTSPAQVGMWESGIRDSITVDQLYAFTRVLGVSVDVLVHGAPCVICQDDPPLHVSCRGCGARKSRRGWWTGRPCRSPEGAGRAQ